MKDSRRKSGLFLWVLAIGVCASAAATQAATNLISDYTFDDTIDNAVSGAPNGVALVGGASYTNGKIGKAVHLNGSGQYVTLPPTALPNASGALTGSLAFWINTTASAAQMLFSYDEPPEGSFRLYLNVYDSEYIGSVGGLCLRTKAFGTGDAFFMRLPTADNTWRDGNWDQVVFTWNATTGTAGSGTAKVYINGGLVTDQGASPGNNAFTNGDVYPSSWTVNGGPSIGGYSGWGNDFAGSLDDYAVWDARLSDTQVKAMYNLANDTLNYGAKDAQTLFAVFADQTQRTTSDGRTWTNAVSLSGNAGDVVSVGGRPAVVLDGSGNGVQAGSAFPEVSITSPANHATIAASAFDIAATASYLDGTVTNVQFYTNNVLVGADSTSPYSCTLTSVSPGSYALTAVVYGDSGQCTTSSPVNVTVTAPPALISDYAFNSALTNLVNGAPNAVALVGGASYTNGKIGKAVYLNGSGQYVTLPTNALPNASGALTGSLAFWINTTASAAQMLFAYDVAPEGTFRLYLNYDREFNGFVGGLCLRTKAFGTGDAFFMGLPTANNTWRDGNWDQVVFTWNATTGTAGSGTAKVYINGGLVTDQGASPFNNAFTNGDVYPSSWTVDGGPSIGGYSGWGTDFAGSLDDYAVWDARLSDTQVKAMYNLANDTLNYGAKDAQTLFAVFADRTQRKTSDGKTWRYTTGLSGSAGSIVNGDTALILDGTGNGVKMLPPWGTVMTFR